MSNRLNHLILRRVEIQRDKLDNLKKSYVFSNPGLLYKDEKVMLNNLIDKLELLNPLKVLGRGYSITYSGDKVIKDVKDVKDTVNIKLYNGEIKAKVLKNKEVNHG
ncbi:MAG: exodeoxyribonuclease VII large subunit [Bacilli bacterium]